MDTEKTVEKIVHRENMAVEKIIHYENMTVEKKTEILAGNYDCEKFKSGL